MAQRKISKLNIPNRFILDSSNTLDDSLSQPKEEIPGQMDSNPEMLNLLKDIDRQDDEKEEEDSQNFRASSIVRKSIRKQPLPPKESNKEIPEG